MSVPKSDRPDLSAVNRHIGERVRKRRVELNRSRHEVAANVDVTEVMLTRYELGQLRVPAAQLYALSLELDVGISYFFEEM